MKAHGPDIANDERKLDALLTDALGPRSQNEVLLLVSAAMAGVVDDLRAGGKTIASDADVLKQAIRIQKEFGVNAAMAKWAAESWAAGLGLRQSTGPIATSASIDAKPSELPTHEAPAANSPQQRLQAAIKQAMADGVITPEEKEKLRVLALEVKGRAQAAQQAAIAAKRKKLIASIAVGMFAVLIVAGAAWAIASSIQRAAERRERVQAATKLADEQRELVTRAEQLRDRAIRSAATIEDFANRLERAAQRAADQQRTDFSVGGRAYTQDDARKTIAAAKRYVADQRAQAATAQALIDRVKPLLDAFAADPTNPESLSALHSRPATLPAELPEFDPNAAR